MCKISISKTEYKDLVLTYKDQIKDIYTCSNNKNLSFKIIKDLSKLIKVEQLLKISKNQNIGLEKILDLEISENTVKIALENYQKINQPKTHNEIANIVVELINIINNLYSIGINKFELNYNKLCVNELGFLIIKDIYFISEQNNHINQISEIIEYLSNNIKEQSNNPINSSLNIITNKILNNEFKNIEEIKNELINFLSNESTPNNIKNTNSYTKIDLEILNSNSFKCNNIINQIKSDKIVNFNVNFSTNNNIFDNFEWLIKLEDLISNQDINNIDITNINDIANIDKCFSGIIIINKTVHIFSYQGYIIGALNTLNNSRDDNAINDIGSIESISFKDIPNNLPLIINNIISSGISLDTYNSYLNKEVYEILEKISDTNFCGYLSVKIEDYTFYMAYDNGQNVFIISKNNNSIDTIDKNKFNSIIKNYEKEIHIEAFILKFNLLRITFNQIILKTCIEVKYKSQNQGTLNDILKLGNEYIPNKIKDSTTNNLLFEKILPFNEKLEVLNGELNFSQLIETSISYRFIKWLITDLFFELNKTDFKNIINNIPLINNISFYGNQSSIKTFFKKDEKILFISHKGNASLEDLNNFINYVKETKTKNDEIFSVFYISSEEFPKNTLHRYKELTKQSALNLINFKNSNKSYIKINKSLGFNIFLINSKFNIFEIINA
jgi:hypothetical protein